MPSIVSTVIATVLITAAAAAPAPAARSCGAFAVDGARLHTKVIKGPTGCETAKRILRRYLTSDAPCSGSGCARRINGWRCSTAPAYAFPRLASCTRNRSTIAAYSTAD